MHMSPEGVISFELFRKPCHSGLIVAALSSDAHPHILPMPATRFVPRWTWQHLMIHDVVFVRCRHCLLALRWQYMMDTVILARYGLWLNRMVDGLVSAMAAEFCSGTGNTSASLTHPMSISLNPANLPDSCSAQHLNQPMHWFPLSRPHRFRQQQLLRLIQPRLWLLRQLLSRCRCLTPVRQLLFRSQLSHHLRPNYLQWSLLHVSHKDSGQASVFHWGNVICTYRFTVFVASLYWCFVF